MSEPHETDYQRARRQRSEMKKYGITGATSSEAIKNRNGYPLQKLKQLVGKSKAIRNGALTTALGRKIKHGYSISSSGREKKLTEKEQEEMRYRHGDTRTE